MRSKEPKVGYGTPSPERAAAAQRLREARIAAGFASAQSFAIAVGVPQSTYQMHEGGKRKLRPDYAERYGKLLRVDAHTLMEARPQSTLPAAETNNGTVPAAVASIEEVDPRTALVSGAARRVRAVPMSELETFGLDAVNVWHVICRGDEMEPTFKDGDRVAVDRSAKRIDGNGVWLLVIDDIPVFRRIEVQLGGTAKVSVDNPRYASSNFEAPRSDLKIVGRAFALWEGYRALGTASVT